MQAPMQPRTLLRDAPLAARQPGRSLKALLRTRGNLVRDTWHHCMHAQAEHAAAHTHATGFARIPHHAGGTAWQSISHRSPQTCARAATRVAAECRCCTCSARTSCTRLPARRCLTRQLRPRPTHNRTAQATEHTSHTVHTIARPRQTCGHTPCHHTVSHITPHMQQCVRQFHSSCGSAPPQCTLMPPRTPPRGRSRGRQLAARVAHARWLGADDH